MTSNLGTTAWTAPEMFVPELMAEYGLKVDVYSFGIVLWEMFECTLPYSGMSRFDIKDTEVVIDHLSETVHPVRHFTMICIKCVCLKILKIDLHFQKLSTS